MVSRQTRSGCEALVISRERIWACVCYVYKWLVVHCIVTTTCFPALGAAAQLQAS